MLSSLRMTQVAFKVIFGNLEMVINFCCIKSTCLLCHISLLAHCFACWAFHMLNVDGCTLQTRHNLKGGKFEGIRDDEAEGLEAELAPLASDSLKYGLADYFCLVTQQLFGLLLRAPMCISQVQHCLQCAFSFRLMHLMTAAWCYLYPSSTVLPEPKHSIDGVYNCAGNVLADRFALLIAGSCCSVLISDAILRRQTCC